jgi:chromosome transmission fidelity protein 4
VFFFFSIGVGLGKGWAAAATDRGNVRIFSIGGVQRGIFSVPGPIVCLASAGRRLGVAFHQSPPIPGANGGPASQSLGLMVWDTEDQKMRTCPLALTPGSQLRWLGARDVSSTSSLGAPIPAPWVSVDSAGVVRQLMESWGDVWTPLLDLQQTEEAGEIALGIHYFTVGITETDFIGVISRVTLTYTHAKWFQ